MGHETVFTLAARLLAVTVFLVLAHHVRSSARRARKDSRRGRELATPREQKRAEKRALKGEPSGIPFGGRLLPESAATSHFLIEGTTGAGKTLTINMLMNSFAALQGIGSAPDRRALVYDAKQDAMSTLSAMELDCDVVTLNPFDARSAAWDIARDVTAPATALQIATNHIPKQGAQNPNSFFTDAARDIFYGLMLSFDEIASERWTYSDLIHAAGNRGRIEAVLSKTSSGRDRIKSYIAKKEDDRTTRNIFSTLRAHLAPFECVAASWSRAGRRVSLREWVTSDSVLVLGNDESARHAIDSVNGVIFQRLSELLLAQPESKERRSWLFLDEVAEAGPLRGLTRLMNKGRSKGVCVVLGVQELASLKEVYGENGAAVLVANANNKALLRVESPESAEWCARMLGEYEEVEIMRSESMSGLFGLMRLNRSRSEQRVRASTVLASEFFSIPQTNRDNGLTGYFLTPHIGAYRATIRAPVLDALLPPSAGCSCEPNFVSRPESDQFLVPWTEGDCERLSIELEQKAAQQVGEVELQVVTPDPEYLPEELVH